MDKYKVTFTEAAQGAGRPESQFIYGNSEDHALETNSISREEIVAIDLHEAHNPKPTQEETNKTEEVPVPLAIVADPIIPAAPVDETPVNGGGGEFGGGGSSGSFDESPASSSDSNSTSDNNSSLSESSSSSDSASSSDNGSNSGGGE